MNIQKSEEGAIHYLAVDFLQLVQPGALFFVAWVFHLACSVYDNDLYSAAEKFNRRAPLSPRGPVVYRFVACHFLVALPRPVYYVEIQSVRETKSIFSVRTYTWIISWRLPFAISEEVLA